MSNAFGEGSGSHNADDRMSIDLVIDTPPSPPLDARLSSKTPISFRASALASLTTTPSHLSIASLHSAPGSANSSSAGSRKGKRKLSALADQDMASLTSSKKKGSKRSTRAAASAASAVTQAIAYNGFQGSINRLTDVIEKSVVSTTEDSAVFRRDKALRGLQDVQDGLSEAEKVKLVAIFMGNQAAAETYLALTDDNIRRGFLHTFLE